MAIPRIFKLPQHRQFNYQPRYYNPAKEEREMRNREIKEELGIRDGEEIPFRSGIKRGSMRHYIKGQKRSGRNTNVRLILILAVLFFMAYLVLFR